jgi:hypothetical protein
VSTLLTLIVSLATPRYAPRSQRWHQCSEENARAHIAKLTALAPERLAPQRESRNAMTLVLQLLLVLLDLLKSWKMTMIP